MISRILTIALMAGVIWVAPLSSQTKDEPKKPMRPAALRLIDINSASQAEIAGVGIDQTTAKKIVEARPFRSKRELVSKSMLTPEQYEKIKDLIVARQPMKK